MNTSDSIIVIPLTQDQYTYIDAIDADLADLKWHARKHHTGKFYAVRSVRENGKRRSVKLHTVILERKLGRSLNDGELPDHENRNPLDNTRKNLRVANHSQNNFNADVPKNNTSGVKGVYWDKTKEKWSAQIGVNGKRKKLGSFSAMEEAVKARHDAEIEYFGEYTPQKTASVLDVPVDPVLKPRKNDSSGENNGGAKLTWDQVRSIRSTYDLGGVTQKQLASIYGVDQTVISQIVRNESWRE